MEVTKTHSVSTFEFPGAFRLHHSCLKHHIKENKNFNQHSYFTQRKQTPPCPGQHPTQVRATGLKAGEGTIRAGVLACATPLGDGRQQWGRVRRFLIYHLNLK